MPPVRHALRGTAMSHLVKTTLSIKPAPEADEDHGAEPKLALATSELMKVIAMSMSGYSLRSYMPDMIDKLIDGGILTLEEKEADEEGEEDDGF